MNQELTQAEEGSQLPTKKVDLAVQYPPSGTLIKIEKGDVFAGAGEQAVTKKQAEILCAPVDSKDVRILPDVASLYLPWSWYADRLTKCFGPMGWSLLPVTDAENNPKPAVCRDNVMYREFILRAEGRFISSAMGECAYNPNNKRMTFGDAVEGAKSNALSRNCKQLGMAPEIYSEGWREEWTKANAVCVYVMGYRGKEQLWRRKTGLPLKGEQSHANPPCPCDACAKGEVSTAKDGKPVVHNPTRKAAPQIVEAPATPAAFDTASEPTGQDEGTVTKIQWQALKSIMKEFRFTGEQMALIMENMFGYKLASLRDVRKPMFAQLNLKFGRMREGEITLGSDMKWQEPPEAE